MLLHINSNRNGLVERKEVDHFFRQFCMPQEYADSFWNTVSPNEEEMGIEKLWHILGPFVLPGYHPYDEGRPTVGRSSGLSPTQRKEQMEIDQLIATIGNKVYQKSRNVGYCFRAMDDNKNHCLSYDEIVKFMDGFGFPRLTTDRIWDLLLQGDPGRAGTITFDKFMDVFGPICRPGYFKQRRDSLCHDVSRRAESARPAARASKERTFQPQAVEGQPQNAKAPDVQSHRPNRSGTERDFSISIDFSKGSDRISQKDSVSLAKLADILKRHPATAMTIEGHTDHMNIWRHKLLSQERVDAVIQELRFLGVQNDLRPVCHDCSQKVGPKVVISKAREGSISRRPGSARARTPPSTGPVGVRAARALSSRTAPGPPVYMNTQITQRFRNMQEAFRKMDLDKDGRISKEEFLSKCRDWNIPNSEAEKVIAQADLNRDGLVDFNEFAQRFNAGPSNLRNMKSGYAANDDTTMPRAPVKCEKSDVASLASVSTRASSARPASAGAGSMQSGSDYTNPHSYRGPSQVFPAPRGLVSWVCSGHRKVYNPSIDSTGVRLAMSGAWRDGGGYRLTRRSSRSWGPTRSAANMFEDNANFSADDIGVRYNGREHDSDEVLAYGRPQSAPGSCRRAASAPGSFRRVSSAQRFAPSGSHRLFPAPRTNQLSSRPVPVPITSARWSNGDPKDPWFP